jgi:DNA-binding NarL/FixJ family response regulator
MPTSAKNATQQNEPLLSSDAVALITETDARLPYGLTDREVDVLTGVARGLSNQQIASRYPVSFRTHNDPCRTDLEQAG